MSSEYERGRAAGREAGIREAAEVARQCIYHDSAGTGFDEDRFEAAILALLDAPAPAGVTVKPLVWEDFEGRGAKSPAFGMANYLIAKWDNRGFELCESYPGYGGPALGKRFYATIDAAKAAAQAHYEVQIRGALDEPDPATIARIVAQLKEGRG